MDILDSTTAEFLKYKTSEEVDYIPGHPDEDPYLFYAIEMDFPEIPTELLTSVYDTSNAVILTRGSDRSLTVNDNEYNSAPLRRWSVEDQLTQWVKENVSTGFTNVSVQNIHGGSTHSTLGAHTDRRRRFSLFYLVEEGGDNIQTKWYVENGQPIWRDQWIAVTNYRDLNLLHSQRLIPNKWYLFNSRIIHDVDQLISTRKTVIVGFDRLPKSLDQIARSV